MDYFMIGCLIFIVYICVYCIVNRICNCIEKCSSNRAVGMQYYAMTTNKNIKEKEN